MRDLHLKMVSQPADHLGELRAGRVLALAPNLPLLPPTAILADPGGSWILLPWIEALEHPVMNGNRFLDLARDLALFRADQPPLEELAPIFEHPWPPETELQARFLNQQCGWLQNGQGLPWTDDRLLARVIAVLERLRIPAAAFSHRDIHPGNLLVATSERLTLIDWAGSGLAHPLYDPAYVLGYYNHSESSAFLDAYFGTLSGLGYQVDEDRERLEVWILALSIRCRGDLMNYPTRDVRDECLRLQSFASRACSILEEGSST